MCNNINYSVAVECIVFVTSCVSWCLHTFRHTSWHAWKWLRRRSRKTSVTTLRTSRKIPGTGWSGETEGCSCRSSHASTLSSGQNLRPCNREDIKHHKQRPKPVRGARRGPASWSWIGWISSGIETQGCWSIQDSVWGLLICYEKQPSWGCGWWIAGDAKQCMYQIMCFSNFWFVMDYNM